MDRSTRPSRAAARQRLCLQGCPSWLEYRTQSEDMDRLVRAEPARYSYPIHTRSSYLTHPPGLVQNLRLYAQRLYHDAPQCETDEGPILYSGKDDTGNCSVHSGVAQF